MGREGHLGGKSQALQSQLSAMSAARDVAIAEMDGLLMKSRALKVRSSNLRVGLDLLKRFKSVNRIIEVTNCKVVEA